MRFVAPFDHQRGVWFYVPILLFGLLPATLWIVPMIRFLLSGESCQAQRRCASLSFLLLAGGWCVFFFTLSGCKLPTYILPAFPSLALACAIFLTRTNRVWHRRTKVVLAMSLAFVVVMNHSLIPWYANYRSPTRQADVLKRYCGDRETKVVCYPRPCNAVAYLLNRSDLRNYRSKQIEELRALVRQNSRTVILCTHRHSLDGLRELLPPEVEITETAHFGLDEVPGLPNRWQEKARKLLGQTALGLCDLAVVEIRPEWRDLLVKKSNRKR